MTKTIDRNIRPIDCFNFLIPSPEPVTVSTNLFMYHYTHLQPQKKGHFSSISVPLFITISGMADQRHPARSRFSAACQASTARWTQLLSADRPHGTRFAATCDRQE
jgi:hypothetical protein